MTVIIPALKERVAVVIDDEQSRLEDLYALQVLDTPPEPRFDRLTRLAATALDTPLAFISLVDLNRQWFKSAYGMDICETSREVSFCAHAIAAGRILVVPNATQDERFRDNPLVRSSPHIRFYAGVVLRGPAGKPVGTLCVIDTRERQLTGQQQTSLELIGAIVEEELLRSHSVTRQQEMLDPTTRLPNLKAVLASLRNALRTEPNELPQPVLLALVRVERLDALEAALGLDGSAFIMTELARRLESAVGARAFVGQTREDKLALIMPLGTASPDSLMQPIVAAMDQPMVLGEHTVRVRLSLGASLFPQDATDAATLFRRARIALWSLPPGERSSYCMYERTQSKSAARSFKMEAALRQAIEQKEFRLVYQPKVTLPNGQIVGAEALLRWRSAALQEEIPPLQFITFAEQTGMINEIGSWVLKAACEQMQSWLRTGFECGRVAVNVSSQQIHQPEFIGELEALAQEFDCVHDRLILELTESTLIEDIAGTVAIMHKIRNLGISLSIDDFGTGFSSLSYLRHMPVRSLKIDRSFISGLLVSEGDAKLVRSIISLSHDLGLKVVAEGVEELGQAEFLSAAGCDFAQGYFFAKPLDPREYLALATRNSGPKERIPAAAR